MQHFHQKLSFREKVGYSLGDGAANLVFQVLMAYQFLFFTKILGLSNVAAGWLFFIGRFFDAFTDPAMGFIADRTKTRWGRFRPWLIWSSLPFAAIFWLTFTSPGWSPSGQTVYGFVMYFLLMAVYTVNNVPYCALNGVMTGDVDERTSLSTFRFATVTIITFIVQGMTLPLVDKFGEGNDAKGWSITMGIFALVTVVLFVLCFLSVKERVEPDPDQQGSARQDMLDTFKNRPWVILFSSTLMIFIMLVVRGGSMPLFMEKIADQQALADLVGNMGLQQVEGVAPTGFARVLDAFGFLLKPDHSNVPSVAYGIFGMLGTLTMFLGVLSSKPLSKLFGKRMVFVGALVLTTGITVWLFFIPSTHVRAMMWQSALWGLAYGPTVPLLWSMIADSADYSEWKTGRRATGFTFAGVVFALKFGLGMGGLIQGWILNLYGYDGAEGVVLTERAITGVRIAASTAPALFIVAAIAILLFYPISKELNYQIGDELALRRRERRDSASEVNESASPSGA
ncbi:MAG: MFS transporter [Pontiellaceae bacterium]|nr:MFS transporter [Pontiellaceae bacterium]MBN2785592.1 MFS transporter [Pontiellaceae bacterium]